MTDKSIGVLILTPFFSPNIGGVETHLDDLVKALDRRGYNIFVQTYSPITSDVSWQSKESYGRHVNVRRYKWFGKNLFHKLEKYPLLDFLYLTPYLLLRAFWFLVTNHKDIQIIHAQGLNAAVMGLVLRFFFPRKKLFMTFHAVYEFDPKATTPKLIKWISERMDRSFCVSDVMYVETQSFGIQKNKLDNYRYWLDLEHFRERDRPQMKQTLQLPSTFTVLFAGRLIEKKGVRVLLEVARQLPNIHFVFIGTGPLENELNEANHKHGNIQYMGSIPNQKMPEYFAAADLLCIPSLYEEGYGRVIMEAVSCGTPVVGSNRGGITEAISPEVSNLTEPTVENIKNSILRLSKNPDEYEKLRLACRPFAETKYSEDNVEAITKWYS